MEDVLSVTEINESIKTILTTTFNKQVKVHGEISNMKNSGQGTYLIIKDDMSSINVVLWGTKFDKIQNGDDVIVIGKISCFTKLGLYQITANRIEKIGIGNLHEQYEKLKTLFIKKGYFSKKRDFPKTINRVGILTAVEGAALQDILYVLKQNAFFGEIHIKNCNVQGQQCPKSIENGIKYFNKLNEKTPFDILIITRGGGSFEDLMGYSSKEVVKAIFDSNIFTISAVGHEIDRMLSDEASDYRAPTPSIAAEIISCYQKEKVDNISKLSEQIKNIKIKLENKLDNCLNLITSSKLILEITDPIKNIDDVIENLDKIKLNLATKLKYNINFFIDKLEKEKSKNDLLDINETFKKGYVIITTDKGDVITDKKEFTKRLNKKEKLEIMFANGKYVFNNF